jgi:hypothetical protein
LGGHRREGSHEIVTRLRRSSSTIRRASAPSVDIDHVVPLAEAWR